jgi:hypothetical protein
MTDNQMQAQIDARREKERWIGEDDAKIMSSFVQKPKDKDGQYALEPMRIRSFVVEYKDTKPEVS